MSMMEPHVVQLHELRQSVWLDNLSRRLVRSGHLARLRDLGVTGITSNPTIFQRAIAGAADYEEDIQRLARDGFVSIEVSSDVASSAARTVEMARELRRRCDRPNVLVKIPATAAGVSAIRQMIAEGAGDNVTLIFSVARYEEVVEAFLSGLEDL